MRSALSLDGGLPRAALLAAVGSLACVDLPDPVFDNPCERGDDACLGAAIDAAPGCEGEEICNGVDDDCDGEIDEGGDARCRAESADRPFCTGGRCGACRPGVAGDCPPERRVCADLEAGYSCEACTEDEHCPSEICVFNVCTPICPPPPPGVETCPVGGTCRYQRDVPAPTSCLDICAELGLGCQSGWLPEGSCQASRSETCQKQVQGLVQCDCAP